LHLIFSTKVDVTVRKQLQPNEKTLLCDIALLLNKPFPSFFKGRMVPFLLLRPQMVGLQEGLLAKVLQTQSKWFGPNISRLFGEQPGPGKPLASCRRSF